MRSVARLGLRVLGFGFWVLDFGFWVLSFGLRCTGLEVCEVVCLEVCELRLS